MKTNTPWRTAALTCALVAAALGSAAANPKTAQFYEDALLRFEKKDFAGAVVQLKNVLKADAKNLSAQLLLGKALLENGQLGAAEVAFTEALRLGVDRAEVVVPLAQVTQEQARPQDLLNHPRFADAGLPTGVRVQLLTLKAAAASDLGTHREAVRLIEEARSLDPARAETWIAEVPIRLRAKQFREGLAAADKALSLAPGHAEALYQRGIIAHLQGDLARALTLYDQAIAARAGHADSLISRAGLLIDLNRADDAARDVATVRQLSRIDPRGAYLAALLAERAGKPAEAKAALNDVTALLDPVPMEMLRFKTQLLMAGGMAHFGLGQMEKARPYLEQAQRQQPGSAVSKLLAQVYLRENNHELAVGALESYLRSHPGDVQAMRLLASVQMNQGRHARAAQLMQDALKLNKDDPAVHTLLGLSLLGSGKFGNAVDELETAFKRDPNQAQAGAALVSLYLQSGQATRALAVADVLVKRQPTNAHLHNLQGMARGLKGDLPGARAAFNEAARLAPSLASAQVNLSRLDITNKAFDAALARLNALLARDEKNVEAMLELARAAGDRGQPAEVQRWLDKAASVPGAGLQPGLQLIDFHLGRGRPDLAAEQLNVLQNKAPEAVVVLLTQARVQLAAREMAAARATLTRASTIANFDVAALVQIAMLQLRAENIAGAAHALDKALTARPDHLNARALMADIELRQGETAKAEARARSLIASHPQLGLGHALLGDVAMARNQRPAAIEAYRRAHQLDRKSDSLLRLFGAFAAGDPEAAHRLAEQWLKEQPGDAAVTRAVAHAHARSGNLKAARGAFERLLKLAPDDAEAHNNLANVLVLLRDPAALKSAERALTLSPQAPHIIGTAGWAAFHAGQTDRALQLLRDARLRDPGNADTRYFLGSVLAQRGRNTEARDELQGALQGAFAKEAQALLGTLR